ncbi:hypothetical protein K8R43_00540 [archaeon]|nr:hypothetical protein [archaeon]
MARPKGNVHIRSRPTSMEHIKKTKLLKKELNEISPIKIAHGKEHHFTFNHEKFTLDCQLKNKILLAKIKTNKPLLRDEIHRIIEVTAGHSIEEGKKQRANKVSFFCPSKHLSIKTRIVLEEKFKMREEITEKEGHKTIVTFSREY